MIDARDRHRPGELPWGWWLRVRGSRIEDEQGRHWRSVRDAFWEGQLGFGDDRFAPEQLELMLRVLSQTKPNRTGEVENRYALFSGDMVFWRFYMSWLQSIGMLARTSASGMPLTPNEAALTPEGQSVLLMLRATREPEWENLPMEEVVAAVTASHRGAKDQEWEDHLQTFEAAVGFRRHVFARERIGRSPTITLTGLATGHEARMPLRRVIWSMVFDDEIVRDELFAWLATRIEQWDHWGGLAFRKGAAALTQHLLSLFVASVRDGSAQ